MVDFPVGEALIRDNPGSCASRSPGLPSFLMLIPIGFDTFRAAANTALCLVHQARGRMVSSNRNDRSHPVQRR